MNSHEQLNCREICPNSSQMIQNEKIVHSVKCLEVAMTMSMISLANEENFVWLLDCQHYVWRKLWVTKKPIGFYRLKWQYLTLPRHFIRMAMHIGFTAKWLLIVFACCFWFASGCCKAITSGQATLQERSSIYSISFALGSLGLPWCISKGLRGMASSLSDGIPFLPHTLHYDCYL